MLRAALGEVYTSAGAEYSYIGIDKFEAQAAEAKYVPLPQLFSCLDASY